jgi:hypothetical protein
VLLGTTRARADEPTIVLHYDRETGTHFKSSDDGKAFTMRLTWRNQIRWTEDDTLANDVGFAGNFAIVRSRIVAEGNVFYPALTYRLEFAFSEKGLSFLKDALVNRAWWGGALNLRVGQFKRPFDREQIVSDFLGEFNERSIADTYVGGGRDIGGGFHNDYERSPQPIEWFVGVFNRVNGANDVPVSVPTCTQNAMTLAITCVNSTPTNVPPNFQPAIVARAGWNYNGINGYSLGDFEGGPLRIALAANYKIGLGDQPTQVAGIDGMLKAYGADLLFSFFLQKQPATSDDWRFAMNVQGGYFLTPKHLLVGARFALAPASTTTPNANDQIEARAALDYFFLGHNWAWMTDFGLLAQRGIDPTLELRTMAQLMF